LFNLSMEKKIGYLPRFDKDSVEHDLDALLVSGILTDRDLERRIDRAAEMHLIYKRYYPYGLWAPQLSVSREMSTLTEIYIPMDEITRSFDRLFSLSLRFHPFHGASIVHGSSGWLDLLQRLEPLVKRPDPASLLQNLMVDEELRRRFVFFNFMPACYGGGFGRYPGQSRFLAGWLKENRPRLAAGVCCLDTACGSGEGTYELAQLLIDSGFPADAIHVQGTTLEPLELFAAAHAFFPHNPKREVEYRRHIGPLFDCGAAENISFYQEEVGGNCASGENKFDIILCNGLLGGPFLHDREELEKTINRLSGRLSSGGILLAADRFHKGWKRLVSDDSLRRMLKGCGLESLPVAEGVGGVRV
jgi:hypothetical protein